MGCLDNMTDLEKLYINPYHGMELEAGFEENTRDNENGIYFLVLYYILKYENGELTQNDIEVFSTIVNHIRTYRYPEFTQIDGIYDRGAGESFNPDRADIRTISYDNLNAIACFSSTQNLKFLKDIIAFGKAHLWRYDNIQPDKPRIFRFMHPREIILWNYLNKSFLAKFFIWEPMLEALITNWSRMTTKPALYLRIWDFIRTFKWNFATYQEICTSGKILALVRLHAVRKTWFGKLTWKVCNYLARKNFGEEGYKAIFNFYFKDQNHPINLMVAKLYIKNKNLF